MIAGVLLSKGAGWAFAVGILLVFLIYGNNFFREGGGDYPNESNVFKKY